MLLYMFGWSSAEAEKNGSKCRDNIECAKNIMIFSGGTATHTFINLNAVELHACFKYISLVALHPFSLVLFMHCFRKSHSKGITTITNENCLRNLSSGNAYV